MFEANFSDSSYVGAQPIFSTNFNKYFLRSIFIVLPDNKYDCEHNRWNATLFYLQNLRNCFAQKQNATEKGVKRVCII